MNLTERILRGPDRRQTDLTPMREQRVAERRTSPRWIEWTEQNESRGKVLGEAVAA